MNKLKQTKYLLWLLVASALGLWAGPALPTQANVPITQIALATATTALPPDLRLVKPLEAGQYPENLIAVGDRLFFRLGAQLWQSDGTPAGTTLMWDEIFPLGLTACQGMLFFRHADELWQVNSATLFASRIKTAFRGPWQESTVRCAQKLFFVDTDAQHGQELWQTDTPEGTKLVKDINPGRNGSGIEALFLFQDKLLFTAYDDQTGDALWRSDGTVTGTFAVAPVTAPVTDFAATQNVVFFKVGCCQLWRVDDALTVAVLVKDFAAEHFSEIHLRAARQHLYVTARQPTDPPSGDYFFTRAELWRSDGSEQGTVPIKQGLHSIAFHPGTSTWGDRVLFWGYEPDITHENEGPGGWYIAAGDGAEAQRLPFTEYTRFLPQVVLGQFPDQLLVSSDRTLWRTDGSITGTVKLARLSIGPHTLHPVGLTQFGEQFAYTQPDDHLDGIPLWVSDGTPGGTQLLVDFAPQGYGSLTRLTNVNGKLFFHVYGAQGQQDGLWVYQPDPLARSETLYLPLISQE